MTTQAATPDQVALEPDVVRPARRGGSVLRGLALVALGVALFVGGIGVDRLSVLGTPTAPAASSGLDLVTEAWDTLHRDYVDAAHLDDAALAHGAIDGMTEAVGDTGHTYLLTPDEVKVQDEDLSGSYGGIGIELDDAATVATISRLTPGAPATAAGLEVGDRITAVDGTSTAGPDQAKVLDTIRGVPGTLVTLTIERHGEKAPFQVSVTRATVKDRVVDWAMIPGTHLAMIQLGIFSEGCAREVRSAIGSAMASGAAGIVLDLRGNPGGLGLQAVYVASVFLPPGAEVVQFRAADGTQDDYQVPSDTVTVGLPLAILVDADSASSSELVAGALQDTGRATIIGTATAGTGTVMNVFPLTDGSELWIGTEQWLTPSGRSAWHVGLTPDIEVSLPDGTRPVTPDRLANLGVKGLADSGDAQLLRAIDELESP